MYDKSNPQRGFTLIEMLVALAILTVITLTVMGALGPWMGLKQKLDTERRMQSLKSGVTALYEANAMSIELLPNGTFVAFTTSAPAAGLCDSQQAAFELSADRFSESAGTMSRDGYANPWCIFISDALRETQDGVDVYYRNVSFVSTGPSGLLDVGTKMLPNGAMQIAGGNTAITISGRDIQASKIREVQRRLNRVSQMYETYFTTRFLANPSRDISVYYFSNAYDSGGAVSSTGGAWTPVRAVLQVIGVSPSDAASPWESFNDIEVANLNESASGVQVRSPATAGTGALPYTALLRARLPAPTGVNSYAVQTVIGNY